MRWDLRGRHLRDLYQELVRVTDVVFYFQVHQPFRLRRYTFFDIGVERLLLRRRRERAHRAARRREVLPADERAAAAPDRGHRRRVPLRVLDLGHGARPDGAVGARGARELPRLAATGAVEFLAETSHHSLSSLFDPRSSARRSRSHARPHRGALRRAARPRSATPSWCRRTRSRARPRASASRASSARAPTTCSAGAARTASTGPRAASASSCCCAPTGCSDDIAFRFSNRAWDQWPLYAERSRAWVADAAAAGRPCVGLFMDYETFGEHQWQRDRHLRLPGAAARRDPGDAACASRRRPRPPPRPTPPARLDLPAPGVVGRRRARPDRLARQRMQRAANDALCGDRPRACGSTSDPALLADWRRLSTSDHLYYMCTKWFSDGDVHRYFSPYASPHEPSSPS